MGHIIVLSTNAWIEKLTISREKMLLLPLDHPCLATPLPFNCYLPVPLFQTQKRR